MQNKTNTGIKSILKTIEDNLTIPLQASNQLVATRHGGTIKLPVDYQNTKDEITRFRALNDQKGNPESKIYDDIGTVVNEPVKIDKSIWVKRIILSKTSKVPSGSKKESD